MSIPGNRGFSGIGSNFTPGPPAAVPSIDSITGSPNPVTEGNTVTWTVSTTNIPDGTVLDWQTTSAADTNPDFGTVTINSNTGTFQYTAVSDGITEGDENKTVIVYGTVSGVSLSETSSTVTFQDPSVGTVTSVTGPASVNEGASATFNVVTANVPDGSTLGWAIVYGGNANPQALNADFTTGSGSFTVTSNAGSFSVPIAADATTEGAEDFRALANYAAGSSSATSGYVVINDTSQTASPAITSVSGPASVNEGASATINVSTSAIPDGTSLSWSINHSTTSSGDFSSNSGTVTINSNAGSFSIPVVADSTTEGTESFTVTVSGTVSGTPVSGTSSTIQVNDTSTAPATPTITVTEAASTVNEGSSLTFNVSTTNVGSGQTLNWDILHSTTTSADFSSTSGTVVTDGSGNASFSVTAVADSTTEGNETFQARVTWTVPQGGGGEQGASGTVTIVDTSTTPAVPAINSVVGPASVNEGSGASISVSTTDIPDGTSLNWTILDNAGEFTTSSGTVTINSNGGVFTVTPDEDHLTEGSETFRVQVSGTVSGTPVSGTSSNITINDTSLTPSVDSVTGPASVNEGSSATINVTTTGIADGVSLNWAVNNVSTQNADFSQTSGTFQINSNAGSFSVPTVADSTTEGSQTFTVTVSGGPYGVSVSGTSGSITINDTSTTPASMDSSFSIPAGWGQQFETFSTFPEAYSKVEFTHESSNNRIRARFNRGGSTTTGILNDVYINYTGLTNITSVQARYTVSSQSCTGSCMVGAFGPTPVTDGYNSGTYYNIGGLLEIGWMAKVDTNFASTQTNVNASGGSFDVKVVCDQGTFTASASTFVIDLQADDGSSPLE